MMKNKKKKYGSGGEVIKKLETAAVNAVAIAGSKLIPYMKDMKYYKNKKIK